MSAATLAPQADELEPGATERILDGEPPPLAPAHDRSCGCWDCIRAFVASVEGSHWLQAAREYHEARLKRGGGPEITPRDRARIPTSTIATAEFLARQGNAGALKEWMKQRPENERAVIVTHIKRKFGA